VTAFVVVMRPRIQPLRKFDAQLLFLSFLSFEKKMQDKKQKKKISETMTR
jgi:hypothetical protein